MMARSAEKPVQMWVIRKERKSAQKERKEDRPDGKVENARSRVSNFPTGPATRQRKEDEEENQKTKEALSRAHHS